MRADFETVAKFASVYAGFVFGVYWIPLRALDAAGFPGSWSTVALNALPLLLVLPVMAARRRVTGDGRLAVPRRLHAARHRLRLLCQRLPLHARCQRHRPLLPDAAVGIPAGTDRDRRAHNAGPLAVAACGLRRDIPDIRRGRHAATAAQDDRRLDGARRRVSSGRPGSLTLLLDKRGRRDRLRCRLSSCGELWQPLAISLAATAQGLLAPPRIDGIARHAPMASAGGRCSWFSPAPSPRFSGRWCSTPASSASCS